MDMRAQVLLVQQKISDKILSIDSKIRLNEADEKSVCSRNIKLEESMIDYNMHGSPSGDNSVRAARFDAKFKKIRKNRNNMNQRNLKSIRIRNTIIKKQKRYVNRMYNELAKMTGTSYDDKKYKKTEHDGSGIESSSNEDDVDDNVVKEEKDDDDNGIESSSNEDDDDDNGVKEEKDDDDNGVKEEQDDNDNDVKEEKDDDDNGVKEKKDSVDGEVKTEDVA